MHIAVLANALLGDTWIYSHYEALEILKTKMQTLISSKIQIIERLEQEANWFQDRAIYWSVYGLTVILYDKYSQDT